MRRNPLWLGVMYYTFHCLLFAVTAAIVKTLLVRYHPAQIVLIQTFSSFLILFAGVLATRTLRKVNARHLHWHGLRALCWVVGNVLYFYALTQLPLPPNSNAAFILININNI